MLDCGCGVERPFRARGGGCSVTNRALDVVRSVVRWRNWSHVFEARAAASGGVAERNEATCDRDVDDSTR